VGLLGAETYRIMSVHHGNWSVYEWSVQNGCTSVKLEEGTGRLSKYITDEN
jgi:hypothetical protein